MEELEILLEQETSNEVEILLESESGGTGGLGTTDYTALSNKPKINGITLIGNKTTKDLGIEVGKEVFIGSEEPTDEEVIWIDPSEEADVDLSEYAKKTDIPSIDGLATEEYVNTAIQNALEVVENGTY